MEERSLGHVIAELGPLFGTLFFALVVTIMVAMLVVGAWGVVRGFPGVRAREPQPG
jgi:hypothetical protein